MSISPFRHSRAGGNPEQLITDNLDIWSSAIKQRGSQGRGRSKKIDLYGIKKLRELILELAVRGLLVPQDPNDEPASVLLNKIAAEKKQLINDGKIKKIKSLQTIGDNESPFNLPKGWLWCRLSQIGHDWGQKTPAADFTYIDVGAINKELGLIEEPAILAADEAPSRARKLVKNGTVIYSTVRPYLLNIAVVDQDFSPEPIASTAFAILHPFEGVSASFIYRYLRSPSFVAYVEDCQTGVAYPAINDKQFFSGLFPLPPSEEQLRIVAKVDVLMALCDQLEQQQESSISAHQTLVETLLAALTNAGEKGEFNQAWARIADHFDTLFTTEHSIDQLKQTILQLAVMGKLVPQDPNDESASVLLQKIAAEKAQLVKAGKIKKQKPLQEIGEDEKPFELPVGWSTTRLGELINLISGQHLKPSEYVDISTKDTVPYITGPAEFGEHHPTYSKYTEHKRALANDGDILITCKGSGIGKQNTSNETIAISRQLMAIQPVGVDGSYIKLITASLYDYFQSKGVGIAIPGISREDITEVVVMLPPLKEQRQIVCKVDYLMALCDSLRNRINESQTTQLYLADTMAEQALI